VVVNDAQLVLSVLAVDNPVASSLVSFLAGKEAPDSNRMLGKSSQTAEEITVTKTSLIDI